MAADDVFKAEYLRQQVEQGLRRIFEAQAGAAATVLGRRTGTLRDALENPKYMIVKSGEGIVASASYPLYIRFLDMRGHGNRRIYNRLIWGILYRETLQDIRYEYHDWLKKHMHDVLTRAGRP